MNNVDEVLQYLNKIMPVFHGVSAMASMQSRIDAIQNLLDQNSNMKLVIKELVDLKDYKKIFGKDDYYEEKRKIAWIKARNILINIKN